MPAPKIAIAVSACAIAVGPFVGYAHHQEDASAHLPMDLFIPGGPPHLLTILDGRWHLLGKLETGS